MEEIYDQLKHALKKQIQQQNLFQKKIRVKCNVLSAAEAIGSPEHNDYPIIKGREVMVEASFNGSRGQAFTDEFENMDLAVEELLTIDLGTNKNRAVFISGLNAVYRHLGLCKKTVHCRDVEPGQCAAALPETIGTGKKVLLVGHQPRFLEKLTLIGDVRALDLDPDNIGKTKFGIEIEPPSMTSDALKWCDMVFATGSTVVNGTISEFIDLQKPVIFYGVTISAAAEILQLRTYCHCGH